MTKTKKPKGFTCYAGAVRVGDNISYFSKMNRVVAVNRVSDDEVQIFTAEGLTIKLFPGTQVKCEK